MPHKLLLADDSITIQRVVELTFAEEDVQVSVVSDGRQAIDRIPVERPDIVLADVGMPERDGYDVAAFVKSHPQLSHIPVVLLTGAFEPLDEGRARAAGCDAVLVKPFDPQTVIDQVRELLTAARSPEPPPAAPADAADSPGEPAMISVDVEPAGRSLEDYFDRLDAAFASFARAQPPSTPAPAGRAAPAGDFAQDPTGMTGESIPAWHAEPVVDLGGRPSAQLANAFAELLAAEQGQSFPAGSAAPATGVSEDLIDEIVRRVLARLSEEWIRPLVVQTAERLLREEMDRVRRG